jgi:hypothetical protein
MEVHYGKIEIISFVVIFRSFPALTAIMGCISRYEADLAVSVVSDWFIFTYFLQTDTWTL